MTKSYGNYCADVGRLTNITIFYFETLFNFAIGLLVGWLLVRRPTTAKIYRPGNVWSGDQIYSEDF